MEALDLEAAPDEAFASASVEELIHLIGEYEVGKRLAMNTIHGLRAVNAAQAARIGELEQALATKPPLKATVPRRGRRG